MSICEFAKRECSHYSRNGGCLKGDHETVQSCDFNHYFVTVTYKDGETKHISVKGDVIAHGNGHAIAKALKELSPEELQQVARIGVTGEGII